MANSQRRILDRNGNQFIPMNVEGQGYNDNFWSTGKVVTLFLVVLIGVVMLVALPSSGYTTFGKLLFTVIYLLVSINCIRYIVFEEKFYYRMYKELQGNEITTPGIFWNIASIKNTEDGAILTYADAKIGVMVRIDRDTITGKPMDFEETHYDAISDFYKEIVNAKYSFVQLNVMEMAGKDPRLSEIDKVVGKCTNDNVRKLVQLQIGHIKNIAQNSLYESDYILIYSNDITKIDTIIPDVIELMFTILNGAYIGYKILNQREIIEYEKESFGIKYFNSTEASLNIYKGNAGSATAPFYISGILWNNGEEQELDNNKRSKLRYITSNIISENVSLRDAKIKERIYEPKKQENVGIDFNKLGQAPEVKRNMPGKSIVRPKSILRKQNNNSNQQIQGNGQQFNSNGQQMQGNGQQFNNGNQQFNNNNQQYSGNGQQPNQQYNNYSMQSNYSSNNDSLNDMQMDDEDILLDSMNDDEDDDILDI
jgi:hypothetical protein